MSEYELTLIFQRLHERLVRQDEKEKLKEERAQRHMVDALRSRIRHLHPPVELLETWEDVRPRIEDFDEFQKLKSEDLRKTAYDKVIRRLKEKEAESEYSERARRDRDRERGNRRNGRHAHRSRSPEPDAYEADRRKAQADRERQYRKSAPTPPVEPRRRDRDHRHESQASGRLNGYDRDRRELDRERSYIGRVDAREPGARELDYGESGRAGSTISGGSTSRKRRDSGDDEGNRRDSKRLRRDRDSRTRTPIDLAAVKKEEEKEEEVLKSGSEEGEIEEA